MTLETRYTIPATVMKQVVDDETLLFDSSTELFFALNEAGAMFWDVICEHTHLQGAFDDLSEMYDVDAHQLQTDLTVFAQGMAEQKLLTIAE